MRRVLMVGYWYPPAVGAAARRTAGFARYLPEYGWEPLVVTSGRAAQDDPANVLRVADVGSAAMARFPDYVWPESPRGSGGLVRGLLRGLVFPDRFFVWRRRARRAARRWLSGAGG